MRLGARDASACNQADVHAVGWYVPQPSLIGTKVLLQSARDKRSMRVFAARGFYMLHESCAACRLWPSSPGRRKSARSTPTDDSSRQGRGAEKHDEVEGLLQPKLNLRVSQRQVLTPGLVQMVSVLALNKLELKEMINTEMVENPVLEEVEESAATIEEMAGREAERERSAEEIASEHERVEKDPFDEIDFGSYFQDYLDPGFRTASSFEEYDLPSFENFLSQPSTLTDHLEWQLGSMNLSEGVRLAADLVVGNLNEDGYLTASDEELARGTDAGARARARRADPI